MRFAPRVLALLFALSIALPGAAVGAARIAPKVVVIVGPVGEATQRYLARGEAAARVAERYTPNVIRVFTPTATWPAVRQALQDASLVVYLGHGNGWPSRYRNSLYPPTQNGFGLNPFAGAGDDVHQYFGEGRIAAEVKLARNAVVLLHHLCYASGNTEPGLAEGTEAQARQRVDNYAAGFIRAGASAVVAEGHLSPAWYVDSILSGKRTVERIWGLSPSRNGNTFTFESVRSPGFVAAMDPDRPGRGFFRSLVVRSGLLANEVSAGAPMVAPPIDVVPAEPTLTGTGVTLTTPYIKGRLLAGGDASLWIPYTVPDSVKLPRITVGVRWDPIDVAEESADAAAPTAVPRSTVEPAPPVAVPAPSGEPAGSQAPEASAAPSGSAAPSESAPPAPSPTAAADFSGDPFVAPLGAPTVAPDPTRAADPPASAPQPPREEAEIRVSLVTPERLGSVVEPVKTTIGHTRIVAPLKLPAQPGRYRLAITLHDRTGIAYDAATQALLPGVSVRVSGEVAVEYLVPSTARAVAGEPFELRAGIANLGATTWGRSPAGRRPGEIEPGRRAMLVAHWVSLATGGGTSDEIRVLLPAGLEGGGTTRLTLAGKAPAEAGEYLLVVDVIDPELGSLAARGIKPALIRVTVEAAPD